MRLRLLSDLHFETHADCGKSFVDSLDPTGIDVLILAGDICTQSGLHNALTLLCQKFKQSKVLMVCGNHEYWGSDRGVVNTTLRRAQDRNPNLHVFDHDVVTLGGKRFLGATLWFPRSSLTQSMHSTWADFLKIRGLSKWVYEANREDSLYLRKEMQDGDCVITHHLPSWRSVHPKYAREATNCFFVSDMEELIVERKPAMWAFGHTHESFQYLIGPTQVVCNPFGYAIPGMLNPKFHEDLTIEV